MSESPILEYWPEGIAAARIPANNNVRLLQALKINPAISATTAAQPGSPVEGDVYILPSSPTGAQWAGFFEDDVVIFYNATWTAYTPVQGLRKFVEDEGEDWQYIGNSSGGWAPAGGGGGGAVDSVNGQIGVVSLDATDIPITDAGGYFSSTDVEGALQELGAGGGGGGGYGNTEIQTISGTTYTASAADGGPNANTPPKFNVFTNTSAKSATFDPESTTALPANGEWYFYNQGASSLTIIAGSGVTIVRPGGGALTVASGDAVVVKRLAADSFLVLP